MNAVDAIDLPLVIAAEDLDGAAEAAQKTGLSLNDFVCLALQEKLASMPINELAAD